MVMQPVYGTNPYVGLCPTTPHHAAGMRIEPPWSPPIAMGISPAAKATALPLEEPPGECVGFLGFLTGPYALV